MIKIDWANQLKRLDSELSQDDQDIADEAEEIDRMMSEEPIIITSTGFVQLKGRSKEFAMIAFAEAFSDDEEESKE